MENKEYSNEGCGMCEGHGEQHSNMGCGGHGGHGIGCQQMFGMRCGRRHYMLRWILGILILAFVFGAGIKLGELKNRMIGSNNNGGYNMMQRGYTNTPEVYYYRGGMMQGLQGGTAAQQQTPTR